MQEPVNKTVDHLFRLESGKMIAVLSKLLGMQDLQTAQDITQDTLLQALRTWSYKGMPDKPAAWLYRVAKNKAIDHLRRQKKFTGVRAQHARLLQADQVVSSIPVFFEAGAIEDSQLRMIFACCHPGIPVDSQIALALKTLCGLSVPEIAKAFLKDEDTIAKRIYRAKEKIKAGGVQLELPAPAELPVRLDAVLHCLYLLFNEGYNSSHPEILIREELCEEAMRMAFMLTLNKLTNLPRVNALLALFCFQSSRLRGRVGNDGSIILLKHQDRSKWYRPLINKGSVFLEIASENETSVYHVEAAIAYLHTIPQSFEETDWKTIHYLYEVLIKLNPGPVVRVQKAIAASFVTGAQNALNELQQIKGLDNYYLYHTAIGQMYFELGQKVSAARCFSTAMSLTGSLPEKQLLQGKINECL